MTALARLRHELHDDAELMGTELAVADDVFAAGDSDLALAVEAVREGYLLHYGTPRLTLADDPDLALLAGDRLYALGLERLAATGELAAIRELSDVISLCAQAHSAGDPDLAEAVWEAGRAAVDNGSTQAHREAKVAAAAGDPGAAGALRAAARQASGSTHLDPARSGRLDVDDSVPPRLTQ